jgi:hypothetical protein
MLSIICCSIDQEAVALLKENIELTIGNIPFEFIAFDNRSANYGICNVYNSCAQKAKYDNLCFIHEDVCFNTVNWGEKILQQLKNEKCGVIGFAGSIVKLKRLTAWNTCYTDMRANYIQHIRGRKHYHKINPSQVDFTPVVTLDGFCLFVRSNVWEKIKFDENVFTHFHCYDMDFTLAVACQYQNYVCNTVVVEHFSEGSFSTGWLNDLRILHDKWQNRLPLYIKESISSDQINLYDRLGEATFIKLLLQKGLFSECGIGDVFEYSCKYPYSTKAWMLYLKYIKYKCRYMLSDVTHSSTIHH